MMRRGSNSLPAHRYVADEVGERDRVAGRLSRLVALMLLES
jgi:hypothetical protein